MDVVDHRPHRKHLRRFHFHQIYPLEHEIPSDYATLSSENSKKKIKQLQSNTA